MQLDYSSNGKSAAFVSMLARKHFSRISMWYVPFEGELETLVDLRIVSRNRLAYKYPPLLKGHKAKLNPAVS